MAKKKKSDKFFGCKKWTSKNKDGLTYEGVSAWRNDMFRGFYKVFATTFYNSENGSTSEDVFVANKGTNNEQSYIPVMVTVEQQVKGEVIPRKVVRKCLMNVRTCQIVIEDLNILLRPEKNYVGPFRRSK